jgi:ATP-dependent helicase/nuclease subunit B
MILMSVRLIIAPPASGKTHLCLELARSRSGRLPESPDGSGGLGQVWVLLPDQPQSVSFRNRLGLLGGALGVRISTFETLYAEILERAGHPVPIADRRVQYRLIQAAAVELFAAGNLPHYGPIHQMPGFINALRERFAEFKRARIWPEQLLAYASTGPAGLGELAQLYLAYQTRLQELDWADGEGLSWLAVEALERQPGLLPDLSSLIVDGFDSFTATQLDALDLLAGSLPEVLITLPGAAGSQRTAQRRFSQAQAELEQRLHPQISTLAEKPHLPPSLLALEVGLFEPAIQEHPDSPALSMLELRSPVEEAREALRWIKALLVRQPGLSPRQAAIYTPDPDQHLPYLQEIAEEFELPLYIDIPTPLVNSPSVQALVNLLSLPIDDYPRRETLEITRSPFFDLSPWELNLKQAALLELISFSGRVIGGREEWLQAFSALTGSVLPAEPETREEEAESEVWSAPRLPGKAQLLAIRDSFQGFFLERLAPTGSRDLPGWIGWLQALLEELNYWERCAEAPREALQGLLQALLFSTQSAPPISLSYAQFLSELLSAVEGESFYADAVPTAGGIRVAHLASARGLRHDLVAILGLSEGIFPQVERPDPFLPEELRQALGMEPRLGRGQASLFYQAVTRADRSLLLTRPYLAEGGEAWEASPYWSAAAAIFPESITRLSPQDLRALEQAGSPAELLFWNARQEADLLEDYGLPNRQANLAGAREVLAARLARTPGGSYEGYPLGLAGRLADRYGSQHVWSASRLEAYTSCPQRFYIQNALRLEPLLPPAPGLEPSQLGGMLHELLELAYRNAPDRQDPHSVAQTLREAAPGVFERAPQELGFHPGPLWDIEKEQWLEALIETIQKLAQEGLDWEPVSFELAFGLGEQPPLEVDTEIGHLRLRGLIDRIDRGADGALRVIDYKTGRSHLSKADLLRGLRLQLPLYALAAEATLGGRVEEGFYWSLGGIEAGSLHLSKFAEEGFPQGPQGAQLIALEHVQRAVQGVRQAAFPPQPPPGGCPTYCPAAGWCWRYEPGGW